MSDSIHTKLIDFSPDICSKRAGAREGSSAPIPETYKENTEDQYA